MNESKSESEYRNEIDRKERNKKRTVRVSLRKNENDSKNGKGKKINERCNATSTHFE